MKLKLLILTVCCSILNGCTTVSIPTTAVFSTKTGQNNPQLRKILFLSDIEEQAFNSYINYGFEEKLERKLESCGIKLLTMRADHGDVDHENKVNRIVKRFEPQAILYMSKNGGQVRNAKVASLYYRLSLMNHGQGSSNPLWKAALKFNFTISSGSKGNAIGEFLADKLLNKLIEDHVISASQCQAID